MMSFTDPSAPVSAPKLTETAGRTLLTRLWRDYVSQHWKLLAAATILMMIEGGSLGVLSYSLQPMFDRVFVGGDGNAIWWVGGLILGLFLIRAVTGVLQRVLLTRIAQLTSTRMQTDLLAHVMTLDQAFFQRHPPGALLERVQGDPLAVQNVWQVLIQGAGRDTVALISLGIVAFTIDAGWTATALVGVPLLILPSMMLQRYVRRKTRQMRAQSSVRATRLDEIFHGIAQIKLNGMEAYQLGRFKQVVGRIVHAQIKTAAARGTLPGLIDVMTGLGFFGVLILGGREIVEGTKTVGEFMSFFTAMALAFQPLRRLGAIAGVTQVAIASLERVYELIDLPPAIVSSPTAKPAEVGDIAFENVRFAYEDGTEVLLGISFTAKAGQTTALVGASGAGKSTIFSLLTRLTEPDSGRITLAGTDTRQMDLEDLRAMISVVTQDAALFDETLRENVTLGRTDISETRLTDAIRAAHVHDFLPGLSRGLDTPAGPRGSALSGGQRQRVAIARALLRDTPILLLDEATSALDAQSERAIQSALANLSEGRTTLVIAHRLATIRDADHIVVMDHGRVVQEGRHAELLSEGGLYSDLYRLQASEGADDPS